MAKIGIIMGSQSDLPVMQEAIDILKEFNIDFEVDIVLMDKKLIQEEFRLSLLELAELRIFQV